MEIGDLHTAERRDTAWKSCAVLLERAQITDFQACGIRSWDDYPSNRYGWVTDGARFLGVGVHADAKLRKGESIARIDLRFVGGGYYLKWLVESYVKKNAAARRTKLSLVA